MFKRIITLLTVTALLCSVLSLGFSASAVYDDATIYGDLDSDGSVSTADAVMVLEIAAGIRSVTDENMFKSSDINNDGAVTLFDARQVLRCAAGITVIQPSGAFSGFDGGGVFGSEEILVAYFNAFLNRIKVPTEESGYFAASTIKTEFSTLKTFNIETVELPAFSFGTSAEGISQMVKEQLIADDEEIQETLIAYGNKDMDLMSIEGTTVVSQLTAADLFGARASYDEATKEVTIEIALPDTELEYLDESGYAKVLNTSVLREQQDSTLLKIMDSSSLGESSTLRELKNCVLKVVAESGTGNVLSYEITYESKVHIKETTFGTASFNLATLKGMDFEKVYNIKYEDFQWPDTTVIM